MADFVPTSPAVHVALLDPGAEALVRFASFGAEEEGVPIRVHPGEEVEPVAAAYEMARSSTFGIGLAIGRGRIVLHESHMPPERPVLTGDLAERPEAVARRFGSNAARLVVRLPFRFVDEPEHAAAPPPARSAPKPAAAPAPTASPEVDETTIARLVAEIVRRFDTRGATS
jgi:hypothetical protein